MLRLLISTRLILDLAALQFTVAPPKTVYVPPGEPYAGPLDVVCETDVSATITWHRKNDGTRLDSHTFNITTKSRTSTLYLQGKRLHDHLLELVLERQGFYCYAVATTTTKKSSVFNFRVGRMPSIDVGPSGDVVDVGTTIELSCSYAEGVPPPRFTWITDANTTTIKGWTMIQDIVHKKSRLIVTDKAEPVHAGNYTCVVVNRFGSVSSKPARIFVRYPSVSMLRLWPMIAVRAGARVTVTCTVVGYPAPTEFNVTRDGKKVYAVAQRVTRAAHDRIVYQYEFAARNASNGLYSCSARNGIGKVSLPATPKRLTVLLIPDPPFVTGVKPGQYDFAFYYIASFDGRSPLLKTDISCVKLETIPENSLPLPSQRNGNDDRGGLLTGLVPGTHYQCYLYLVNAIGKSRSSEPFVVATKNGKPGVPLLSDAPLSAREKSLLIQWSVAYTGGTPITQYEIVYKVNASNQWEKPVRIDVNKTTVTQTGGTYQIKELRKDTVYSVYVIVQNALGKTQSQNMTYRTACEPMSPTEARFEEDDSISLLGANENDCGAIVNYVAYKGKIGMNVSVHGLDGGRVKIFIGENNLNYGDGIVEIYAVNEDGFRSELPLIVELPGGHTTSTPVEKLIQGSSANVLGPILGVLLGIIVISIIILICCYCRSKQKNSYNVSGERRESNSDRYTQPNNVYDCEDASIHPGPNSGSTYVSDEKWPSRADDGAETPTSVPADFSFDETDDDVDAIKLAREETPPSLPERIYDEPPAESDHLESIPMKNANKSVYDYSQKLSTFV
ncbi:receptor-type tyrosine-protein phosphatase F-like [Oscarella lobularis]|uniref:receptor-type tyrosine-protein phosphatase F-like n=1 Tax=Oscarella lobularis TaxID=121494 RepID=UPI00331403F8